MPIRPSSYSPDPSVISRGRNLSLCWVRDPAKDVKSVDGGEENATNRSRVVGNARVLAEHARTRYDSFGGRAADGYARIREQLVRSKHEARLVTQDSQRMFANSDLTNVNFSNRSSLTAH